MAPLMITVSGLRGVIGESLTPEIAARYARAFAADIPVGPIIVARDSRPSGRMLADAIRANLNAVGRDVIQIGIAATPTVGVVVRESQAAGAIQISASHNPPEYNGMKLFGGDGSVLNAERGASVKRIYDADPGGWVAYDAIGSVRCLEDPHAAHLERVLGQVDREAIAEKEYKVVLDANHGAGGILGRRLLEALGCKTIVLGESPDGQFVHPPEPTETNLASVGAAIVEHGADIGFCQDPDADRLAIIDEQGRYLGEESTLALCLQHILARRPGPIVTNCATSRMAMDLANRFGVKCHLAPVGEANVVGIMRQVDAVFGGEGNGGPIDPEVGFVRDSFVGMALVLDSMAQSGLMISQLADRLPHYAIVKRKTPWSGGDLSGMLDKLRKPFAEAEVSTLDGLRFDWPDAWLLVRPSNTEPIVRLIAEAGTTAQAESLCRQAAQALGVAEEA